MLDMSVLCPVALVAVIIAIVGVVCAASANPDIRMSGFIGFCFAFGGIILGLLILSWAGLL